MTVHHGRMVRAFRPDPVEAAVLERVLDAGRRAPAAGNTAEGRAFVVLARPPAPATGPGGGAGTAPTASTTGLGAGGPSGSHPVGGDPGGGPAGPGGTRGPRPFGAERGGGPEVYWDVALPAGPRREAFAWPGLLLAPVLVVVCVRPEAWAQRYAEADKGRGTTLGRGAAAWPQPFWWFDAGAATEAMLLAARAEGLGACLFGLFEREAAVLDALGVPAGWRGAAVVALGHPDPAGDPRPGRSAARPRPPLDEVVHRGRW